MTNERNNFDTTTTKIYPYIEDESYQTIEKVISDQLSVNKETVHIDLSFLVAPTPGCDNYIDVEQNTDEWFQARKFKVTGSRVSSLVGFHGRKDFTETWDIVINGKEQKDLSHIHNIKRGHDYEKEALNYFENLAKCSTAKCGFFKHPQDSLFGCSPDALGPSGILIEIKTRAVRSLTQIMGLSEYPHYYLQCQLQMDCTNAHSCVLFTNRQILH